MHGASSAFPMLAAAATALLQSCARTRSLAKGKLLHAHLISAGFLSPLSRHPLRQLLPLKLAPVYALCGDTVAARFLFDEILPERWTPFLCNTLIRVYLQDGLPIGALHLFEQMTACGCCPDKFTFTFMLKACAELSWRQAGAQVHCMAWVMGFMPDGYVQNSLMAMYMSCGDVVQAGTVFDEMRDRTIVSWNTMISGLFQNGHPGKALKLYDQMVDAGVDLDCATVVSVLPACACLKDLVRGRQVHMSVNEKGFCEYIAVKNSLIDMYSKCGSLEDARSVFDEKECQRDVVSWTTMIGGYILHEHPGGALALSHEMMLSGIKPNAVTMASLLSACTSSSFLNHGRCVHGSCVRLGHESEIIVETALIDMYGKCGSMHLSLSVFMNGSRRTATWNALISSYAHHKLPIEAIKYFKEMHSAGVRTDMATIVSLLPAYSDLADSCQARNIHGYLIRMGFHLRIEATTGLIDVYAKNGSLKTAHELFDGLIVKDTVSWSALIAGYGMHGHARTVILLFKQMEASGVEPNEITFTSMLYSCSHAGLVDEGLYFFHRMLESPHMKPQGEHYACIIDLLGRAGRLDEAYGLIKAMPFKPNHAVWGALLGACVIHVNVELGEKAAGHLFDIEPENTGNYVLLGNIYSAVGRWEDAENVRNLVKHRGLKKEPGCSLIELPNPLPHASWDQTKFETKGPDSVYTLAYNCKSYPINLGSARSRKGSNVSA
uniref:Pentatricopeptide repeat-containing protein At5g39350 n=1 Tax=Anthurium amnicola TaxID=1678845 RepID=A0A1D1XL03_9ARAE